MKTAIRASLAILVALAVGCGGDFQGEYNGYNPHFNTHTSAQEDCLPDDPNTEVFTQAVCVCENFGKIGNAISTESFSSLGSTLDTEHLGHVGINGKAGAIGNMIVDGVLDIRGSAGSVGNLRVMSDLHTGGDFGGIGRYVVDADAYVGGDLVGIGYIRVGGSLNVNGDIKNAGVLHSDRLNDGEPYVPHDPCPCGDNEIIDVAAEVAAKRHAKQLTLPDGIGHHKFTVTAGDYYLPDGNRFIGNSIVTVQGHVRLFVDGDLEKIGNSMFILETGAELDLYVSGSVRKIGNIMSLGDRASRDFRLYVGGSEEATFDVIGNSMFKGSIYAPRADLRYIGNMMVAGSLFARNIHGIGNLMVRYDAGLQGLGEDCEEDDSVVPDQLPDPDDDPDNDDDTDTDCDPLDDTCINGG